MGGLRLQRAEAHALPGSRFGDDNATSATGEVIVSLTAGDVFQLVNQSAVPKILDASNSDTNVAASLILEKLS